MDELAKQVKKKYDELMAEKGKIETEIKPLEAYLKTSGILSEKKRKPHQKKEAPNA